MIDTKTETKKKLYIKVPSNIVRNDGIYLSNSEFLLYARLCFLYFRNYGEKEIVVDHRKLMKFANINDARTFRKRLNNFFNLGLIENQIDKLPTKGNLTIIFNPEIYEKDEHFTLMSAEVFSYLNNDQIDEYAFRQLFYYKSHINLDDKERDRSFCFVGYDTLIERLKVSKTKISEANEQLKKAKLVKIVAHKLETDYEYNEADELVFDRWNNHYYVANSLF